MIRLESVSCAYPGTGNVLNDISFEIKKGESVGLIGANGTGKSTLFKALVGLIDSSGKIIIDGQELNKNNIVQIRKKTGFVIQDSDNQMFMPTVIDDITFGLLNSGMNRKEAEQRAEEVLEKVDALNLKDRHNHKISGGEKKIAAIATVLAMQPEIILMDEPSSTLDPKNRRKLIGILNQLDVTKIIATHDLDLVLDTCDRVIIISDGSIAADGEAKTVLRNKELLEANGLELPLSLIPRD